MGVRLNPVTPDDDAAIEAYHGICEAARAHDNPDFPRLTREHVAGEIRHPSPSRVHYHYLVHDDSEGREAREVGAVQFSLPTEENLHLAMVELWVHPDHRRRGVGRETFDAIRQLARDHGRSMLLGEYCEPLEHGPARSPGPAAFAQAVGAQRALPEVRRRLDLTTVDSDAWRSSYDDALRQAKGYSVVWWSGSVPDDFVTDVAYLDSRLVRDAPMGELRYEPEKVDASRVRAMDDALLRRGQAHFHAAARDDQTGRVVAWSALFFSVGVSTQAWQGITIVDPDHRGHRLGLLVKLENLLRTRQTQPDLRYIDTWNAAENAHMIAINEAIGFRPVDGWVTWQCDVDAAD
jgi:GNAT superfamily N-acetyltransferase